MTATSTIAIDDEVRDQGQRLTLLRRGERLQRGLRRPRVAVRLGQGVLDTLVTDDVAPDLVDLLRVEGVTSEKTLHTLRFGLCRPGEHRDERQGPLPLAQVGADRLAEPVLIGDEVERVVRDLKRDADVHPVLREGIDPLGREPAQEPPDATARRDERRGLLGDDSQIIRLGDDPAPLELQLEDLGLRHRDRGPRERLHHGAVVVPHEHRERLRVQMIADQHRRVVTPLRVRRWPPAAERSLVDDVVVDEGRRVEHLDHAGQPHAPRALVACQACGQEEEHRPQALAAGARDVAAHLLNQRHGRVELAADLRLDALEVGADQTGDALLEDPLEGARGHASDYFGTTRSLTWTRAPGATVWTSATENRSRISVTRAVPTSSSSSPSISPVTGCTSGIASRRRLTRVPARIPSTAVRSMTMRVVST